MLTVRKIKMEHGFEKVRFIGDSFENHSFYILTVGSFKFILVIFIKFIFEFCVSTIIDKIKVYVSNFLLNLFSKYCVSTIFDKIKIFLNYKIIKKKLKN